jgi:site-specific recombinase XerD
LIFGSSVNYFTQKFTKLKKQLSLPKEVTMYAIKHTRAIHLAQDGADPYSIMQLFRHSGLDITMAYLRDLGVNVNRQAANLSRNY